MYTPPDLSKSAAIGQIRFELGDHDIYIVLFQMRLFTLKFDLEKMKKIPIC